MRDIFRFVMRLSKEGFYMTVEGIKNVQAAQQMSQVSQPKVTEAAKAEAPKVAVEPLKVNTEDAGLGNNKEYSNEQIKKTVADMNKKLQNISCQYGIHEGTGRVTIKMVDRETKDVIKEFPAEETLELIAKAWELAGIMVDKRL
ncbi:MAG: flagellar protein FlaG [Lachnospiraceae bacterium]|nr:flagellar protein FlaG [Lachnospiraceae bacterium]